MATKEYTHTIVTQAHIVSLKRTRGGMKKQSLLYGLSYISPAFSPAFSPSPLQ